MTARDDPPTSAREPQARSYRSLALVVASAMFMQQMDATVLTIALPAMARDLETTAPGLSLALTSYLLALAIFIPVSGRLADRYGARTIFCTAIIVFLAGSALCAQSTNLEFLIFSRFFQGLGGAMMVPVGRLVLLRNVAKEDLVSALSWLVIPALLGPVIGPPIGGLIVTYLDWRWIFYLNIPVGLIGLAGAIWLVRNQRASSPSAADFSGFILSSLALGCLLFGFELASRPREAKIAMGLILIGIIFGLFYVRHAVKTPHAILQLSLLRVDTFRLSVIAGSLTRITQGAQPFLLPLMFQLGFGFSAVATGTITMANAIGALLMKSIAPRILKRWGFRSTLIAAGIGASVGYGLCAAFRPDWPIGLIVAVMGISGFFMSYQFTAYNAIAFAEISPEQMSSATSFYATFQQLSLSLGICLAAGLLHGGMYLSGASQPSLIDFSAAMLVVAMISASALYWNRSLTADAGAELSGQASEPVDSVAGPAN